VKLDWSILWGEAGALLWQGLLVTLQLSFWSLLFATALGVVFGVVRWVGWRWTEPVCWLYVELARNTPPLVQILFWYFSASAVLPAWLFLQLRHVGYEFGAAVVALSIYHGGFIAEVVRAGLRSVPAGQLEAARALGLGFPQALSRVVLPQAARIAVPPLVNEATALIKNTSLAMAVGVAELTFQYRQIDNFQFRGVEALTAITLIYLLLCLATAGAGRLVTAALSSSSRGALQPRVLLTSE
jgi:polar amino acid transport system permease protein